MSQYNSTFAGDTYVPPSQTTTTNGGWRPPSTAPEPGKVFGAQVLYCYRCKTRHDLPYRPGVRITCPVCGAALIPWELDALANVLHNQDLLLEEGKRYSKLYEDAKKDLEGTDKTASKNFKNLYEIESRRLADFGERLRASNEQGRRLNRELEELRDTYYHPDTHTFCRADQTASAGMIGRVRSGWSGQVFRIHDLTDMRRLRECLALLATPPTTKADSSNKVSRLERRVSELEDENSRLRAAASEQPTRSRRSLE